MFPMSATSRPSCSSIDAASVAVVLFPLVPVMASTLASAKSSNHSAIAVVITTPASSAAFSSDRYRLTPGERTTTSMSSHRTPPGLCTSDPLPWSTPASTNPGRSSISRGTTP